MTAENKAGLLERTSSDYAMLTREGLSRGRIWTALELMDLLGLTPEQVKTIARAKAEFAGEIVAVQSRRREETP